ncbi:2-succinyl-5-enolpyruvyl-6-hydroxy-3-cyclohexene-1-carboxylic-acid synthase [Candidatus Marinamargulisbacteria bacterium SCGC AG-343-D04]|nr:2-succinyl-5-enolpyruvyl-6-hydroxy-3-cyclohexene-1-carboxylic-acid synthase [Candidatus Marinamargulisbacteria bacterium SCGC AG-343-D04]
MIYSSISHATSVVIVEELVRLGVRVFCIAPGSRSTPLVQAISQREDCQIVTHYDERSMGFFALGVAKVSRIPTVVVTTSGTAVANLLPSCVEAFYSQVPLIYITADRPKELQGCGANQSIKQTGFFDDVIHFKKEMTCPDETQSFRQVLENIDECFYHTKKGPVHINIPFREPFFDGEYSFEEHFKEIRDWTSSTGPLNIRKSIESLQTQKSVPPITHKKCLCLLSATAGPLNQMAIESWSKNYCVPLLAECSTTLASSKSVIRGLSDVMDYVDKNKPEIIISIGAKWISKDIQQLLKETQTIIIHDFKETQDWLNCAHTEIMTERDIEKHLPCQKANKRYYDAMRAYVLEKRKHQRIKTENRFDEECCVGVISEYTHHYKRLFIGNSLVVRNVNNGLIPDQPGVQMYTQRGASGIDGLLSTACGIAYESKEPVMALVGDLSFLHDINGLYFLKQGKIPLTIIILNNNGGKIFSLLPIAKESICTPFFVMPHGLNMEGVCKMFDCDYTAVYSEKELKKSLDKVSSKQKIIEVIVEE